VQTRRGEREKERGCIFIEAREIPPPAPFPDLFAFPARGSEQGARGKGSPIYIGGAHEGAGQYIAPLTPSISTTSDDPSSTPTLQLPVRSCREVVTLYSKKTGKKNIGVPYPHVLFFFRTRRRLTSWKLQILFRDTVNMVIPPLLYGN